MNTIANNLLEDLPHYASNDSGLSSTSNSNGGCDIDHKTFNSLDNSYSDDLTKSLFINSFRGAELIQDDDIYSYKSKMEHKTNNSFNRLLSVNLSKVDNIKTKNPDSLSNIFHDLAKIDKSNVENNGLVTPKLPVNQRPLVTNLEDILYDSKLNYDNVKLRKNSKKTKLQSSSNEYVSSSIKNYKGDKNINDLVDFIQGKANKSLSESFKSDKSPKSEAKIELKVSEFPVRDSGVYSEQTTPTISIDTQNSDTVFNTTPQSSQFVSWENSEEDVDLSDEFQEVKSKAKKKQVAQPVKTIAQSSSNGKNQRYYRSRRFNSHNNNEQNKSQNFNKSLTKIKNCNLSEKEMPILDSTESFQAFLSHQYHFFVKNHS